MGQEDLPKSPPPQNHQLMSKRRSQLQPQLRRERRDQDNQRETEKADYPASLGDSLHHQLGQGFRYRYTQRAELARSAGVNLELRPVLLDGQDEGWTLNSLRNRLKIGTHNGYQIRVYLHTRYLTIETLGRNLAVRHSEDLQSMIVPFDDLLPKRDQHETVLYPFGNNRIRQDLRVIG